MLSGRRPGGEPSSRTNTGGDFDRDMSVCVGNRPDLHLLHRQRTALAQQRAKVPCGKREPRLPVQQSALEHDRIFGVSADRPGTATRSDDFKADRRRCARRRASRQSLPHGGQFIGVELAEEVARP